MTESCHTAPLRGQSLRGRPVHEICTPVNEGNRPLCDEGEAAAWPPPYPLVLFRNHPGAADKTSPPIRRVSTKINATRSTNDATAPADSFLASGDCHSAS